MRFMASRIFFLLALVVCGQSTLAKSAPKGDQALIQLLDSKECQGCLLTDVDLVHAQLQNSDLAEAKLQRANLNQAQLDGANLSNADLSFTSLRGASLRGADLRGSKLTGTDLREADLTNALLNNDALKEAHWSGAKGINKEALSHAALHNAGVSAVQQNRLNKAEDYFSQAISKRPQAAESWVARGITREKLGKRTLAIQDFHYAGKLFHSNGLIAHAEQLEAAAISLKDHIHKDQTGNGLGSALLGGLISTSQALIPIAMKLFMPPIGF